MKKLLFLVLICIVLTCSTGCKGNIKNDTVCDSKDGYTLKTYFETFDEIEFVGVCVYSDSEELLFKSEPICRSFDLQDVYFANNLDIVVESGDIGTVVYGFDEGTWKVWEA